MDLTLFGALVGATVSEEAAPISATSLIGLVAVLMIVVGTLYYIEHIR